MRRRLPPLRALVAFEATVRLGSATAAAADLNVTHGAVCKQLDVLEEALGQPLFLRSRPHLVPTPEAAQFAATIAAALDRIADGTLTFRGAAPIREVRVIAPAAFAMRWLIPRLHGLHAAGSGLSAVVRTTDKDDDWRSLVFDVAVRRGQESVAGLERVEFMREVNTLLVGRASWMAAARPLPAQLPRWTFCEARTRPGELDAWLRRAGVDPATCRDRRMFPRFYLAVEAALADAGAVVGPIQILADELRDARLVAPFPQIAAPGDALACVFDPRGPRAIEAHAFVEWLAGAAAAEATGRAGGRPARPPKDPGGGASR